VEYSTEVVFERWSQSGKRFFSADLSGRSLKVESISPYLTGMPLPRNAEGYPHLEHQARKYFETNTERFERDAIASLDVFP
jgi:hypothetical protein